MSPEGEGGERGGVCHLRGRGEREGGGVCHMRGRGEREGGVCHLRTH